MMPRKMPEGGLCKDYTRLGGAWESMRAMRSASLPVSSCAINLNAPQPNSQKAQWAKCYEPQSFHDPVVRFRGKRRNPGAAGLFFWQCSGHQSRAGQGGHEYQVASRKCTQVHAHSTKQNHTTSKGNMSGRRPEDRQCLNIIH